MKKCAYVHMNSGGTFKPRHKDICGNVRTAGNTAAYAQTSA